jgi:hypothetical protein
VLAVVEYNVTYALCFALLCFSVLCCAVLCCAVLCCAVLCCAVPRYATRRLRISSDGGDTLFGTCMKTDYRLLYVGRENPLGYSPGNGGAWDGLTVATNRRQQLYVAITRLWF